MLNMPGYAWIHNVITTLYPEFGHIKTPPTTPNKNLPFTTKGSRASMSFIRNKERTNSSCTGTEPPTKPATNRRVFLDVEKQIILTDRFLVGWEIQYLSQIFEKSPVRSKSNISKTRQNLGFSSITEEFLCMIRDLDWWGLMRSQCLFLVSSG